VKPQVEIRARFVRSAKFPEITTGKAPQSEAGNTDPDALIANPRMICRNGQRVQAISGKLHDYVADMEVAGDNWDPVVATTLEGSILDVRPILTQDRKYVELDLHFQMRTNLRREVETLDMRRPTQPASEKAPPSGRTRMRADLDTLSVDTQEVRTQLRVASGKWALVACLHNRDEKTKAKEPYLLFYITAAEWSAE
jgi:hypothetical protein